MAKTCQCCFIDAGHSTSSIKSIACGKLAFSGNFSPKRILYIVLLVFLSPSAGQIYLVKISSSLLETTAVARVTSRYLMTTFIIAISHQNH